MIFAIWELEGISTLGTKHTQANAVEPVVVENILTDLSDISQAFPRIILNNRSRSELHDSQDADLPNIAR